MYNIFLYISILFLPIVVFAHGSGVSFEEVKNGYKIDIGHEEFIAENESVRFDFTVYPENIENIDGDVFTDVWVTFTKENKIYFAGGIDKPTFGTTGLTYVFPETGTYTVSARFQKEGETVVKSEFPLEVIRPLDYTEPTPVYVLPAIVGLLCFSLGSAGMYIFLRIRKN